MASAPPAPRASQPLPFASPEQLDPRLQDFLEQASRQLCVWLGSAAERSPLPGLSVLPPVEPEDHGLAPEMLLADLQLVMDGAFNPNHPGALAHLDPPPLPASVAADLICAGLNNNMLAEELSPSLSRLEPHLAVHVLLLFPAGMVGGEEAATRVFERAARSNPSGRMSQDSDYASVVAFLLSPAAEFVQGQVIHANGGAYVAG